MVAGTHVAACREAESVELSAVWGRDAEKARAFASDHGVARVHDSLDALAGDPDLDFVIVATPPDARMEIIEALAAAGKPILLEKPVERDLSAARRIVKTCREAEVPLGVVFQHRARKASTALKRAIDDGKLGRITNVEIRVPWWREQSYYDADGRGSYTRDGGGVLITQAIHTIDLALWLLGPVAAVQARLHLTPLHEMEAEDWAGALLQFRWGAVGTLMATTAAYPGGAESLFLQGTKGAAKLSEGVLTMHFLSGRSEKVGESAQTGGGADPMAFTHAWHQAAIEDFTQALTTGRAPLAPGDEALWSHALIGAMEEASRTGTVVEVPET